MFFKSKLLKLLDAAREGSVEIQDVTDAQLELTSAKEAKSLASLLNALEVSTENSDLFWLAAQCRSVDEAGARHVRELVLPALLDAFDRAAQVEGFDVGDLVYVLATLAMYEHEAGVRRLLDGIRRWPDDYGWSRALDTFTKGHAQQQLVLDELGKDLPQQFAGVAFLDLVNQLCINDELTQHPFDTEAGVEALVNWLSSDDETEYSYAHSATAALPFLSPKTRQRLLPLAEEHPAEDVRLEAAWAAAKLGEERGFEALLEFAEDPRNGGRALRYLHELDPKRLPPQAEDPRFLASCEMCEWLAHPSEMGAPPDRIDLVDSRELYWPPSDDHRVLYLFRYGYDQHEDEAPFEHAEGHGLVGSITFALFGETTAELSPMEVYALHCCWELEFNEDGRAPEKRTVATGLKLLREHNPELAKDMPN